jgi:hypothetical protein
MIVQIGEKKLPTSTPWAMKAGQVGRVISGSNVGEVLLRTFEGVVSLQDPERTWRFEKEATAPVMLLEIFNKGTQITLTLEV